MNYQFNISPYTPEKGIDYEWIGDCSISTSFSHNEMVISANRDGLLTLARFCLSLAQESVPAGVHIHFDAGTALEDGSVPMVLQRTNQLPEVPPAAVVGNSRI